MKRIILRVGMLFVTFTFGIGIHWLLSEGEVENTPPPKGETISPAPIELQSESPVPAEPAATPRPIFVLDYDHGFAIRGVLYIMGRKTKEFADIHSLAIVLGPDDDGYIGVSTCAPGVTCDGASANFALVTERRLFFATSQLQNSQIEYRFDGTFLRTDFDAVYDKNIPVLRGTLTKTKAGRKIAEGTFTFSVEYLGC